MTQYSFIITEKIIPAVRMTRRGKWTSQRAQDYLASKEAIGHQLKQQMRDNGWKMMPPQTSLAVELSIGTDKVNISDLDNLAKAVLDSANKIVYYDDCWIDKINVWRYKADTPKAEFTVWLRLEKGNPQ